MKIFKNSLLLAVLVITFAACNEEFSTIDSDIINENTATNFNVLSEKFEVISYTEALGPVQTNGLSSNMLGVFNDPNYGRTEASIVTQVNSSLIAPDFGNNIVIDSVVLTLPLSNNNLGLNEDNNIEYELTSVLPESDNNDYKPIKLSIFENNYFLRDFDPNEEFDTAQRYFSNKSASASEQISESDLEFQLLVEETVQVSNEEIILTDGADEPTITQRLAPSIRLAYSGVNDPVVTFFKNKIFDLPEGNTELSNSNNFNDYFRGIYFKAEPLVTDGVLDGSLIVLNLQQEGANFTVYYSNREDDQSEDERNFATYTLTFAPNRINFLENDFTINSGNETEGDSRLFVKAGEGAIASIDLLFNSTNDNSDINNLNEFKRAFANYENDDVENGEFLSYKRLINEVNLVFYVDQNQVNGEEPNRLFLYNKTDQTPLADFFNDTQNSTIPLISIPNHLGILERVDNDIDNEGIKYTMKITEHVTSILENNQENVQLGLAVSGNVNLEALTPQFAVQTANNDELTVPVSSLLIPRGTILHGNKSGETTGDLSKRLYLEIIYTCLNTDDDCGNN